MKSLSTFTKVSLLGLAFFVSACDAPETGLSDDHALQVLGRYVVTEDGKQKAGWPGSGVEFRFKGKRATIEIMDSGEGYMDLSINDSNSILDLKPGTHDYVLVDSEVSKDFHIRLTRRSESYDTGIYELGAPKIDGEFTSIPPSDRKIVFLGDSITAGFGVGGTTKTCENSPELHAPLDSYAHLTADALNADAHLIAISGRGVIHNWDSNPAPVMPAQIDLALPDTPDSTWDNSLFQPDAVVVTLGTNDWSVIDPGKDKFRRGYRDMLSKLRATYPTAHIVTVGGPLLSGEQGAAIRDGRAWALEKLKDPNMSVLDVELADYGVVWSCNYHPGKTSMKKIARALSRHLETTLGWTGSDIPMPLVIKAPEILSEDGKAHFGKRLEDVTAVDPIHSGSVLIGDSITEAWMWQADSDTYPFKRPVSNHGVSWDVTQGAVLRLPLIEPSAPDQIFIKIGTNDISLGVPLEDMEAHFEALLSGLAKQEPQAQIFVQSVLPREADKLDKVAKVNAMQSAIAEQNGAIYIDLTPTFAQSDGTLREALTYDGLHLNEAGYAVWGNAISSYVK